MATHTPGPFRPWKGAGEGDDYEPDRWCVVVDGPRNYLVATIENGAPGDTLETEAANARLFAAADKMLAALRLVLEFRDGNVGQQMFVRKKVREAIDAATGA